jgi:hypothetical protein
VADGQRHSATADLTDLDVAILGFTAIRRITATESVAEPARVEAEDAEDYVTLIRSRTPLRAGSLLLAESGANEAATRISVLPKRVAAVFISGMQPAEAACTQLKAASLNAPVVISESDLVTAVLAAAAITTLRRHSIRLPQGRIALRSPEVLPRLRPVLRSAGVATVTIVSGREHGQPPPQQSTAHHDVLIDLSGTAPPSAMSARTLAPPCEPFDHVALILPGLLTALCRHRTATLTIDILAACARAVSATAPPSQLLLALTAPLLVPTVTRQVVRALRTQAPLVTGGA